MNKTVKVALVGNPNVGKSTVFNLLTGLKQHTGNWTGKTVGVAEGKRVYNTKEYVFVDLPGTYSYVYNSPEEKVTSDYISNGCFDITMIICDATTLERNLILALQTIEISNKCIVCLNMMDEARKKNICIDIEKLSKILGVPVIGISARKKQAIKIILDCLENTIGKYLSPIKTDFVPAIMDALEEVEKLLTNLDGKQKRQAALNILEGNTDKSDEKYNKVYFKSRQTLDKYGYDEKMTKEKISYSFVRQAERIAHETVCDNRSYSEKHNKADRIITGKYTSIPITAMLLVIIFWLTIVGSNYPSNLLSTLFGIIENKLFYLSSVLHVPTIISSIIINGIYKVVSWVISVMLPPMMIFFPLFTLLEDVGYLPRLAFSVDHYFQKFNACGKQALTYCMSFGCNAAGITSTRIIDSNKEKLIAIITNNFIPCNGRFPILISIITMFLIGSFTKKYDSLLCAVLLAVFIVISVICAMFISKLLSKTLLKAEKTSYTLELPPYRNPQIGKIVIRSIFDRTIFVLGRAVAVAAPAGLVIWLLSNLKYNDCTYLFYIHSFLDPIGKVFGMDGVILLAFILGLPANEIVIPITVMCYMQNSNLNHINDITMLKYILTANGWTVVTAVCVVIFTIMHWPCSTSIITVYRETKNFKWTLFSVITPTACGLMLCFIVNLIGNLLI